MNVRWTSWKSHLHRFLHSWQAPTAAGVVILLGMVVWLAPRPVDRVVPVDDSTSWTKSEAPPRREVVWQPARTIPALFDGDEQAELVSPKLAGDGTALYFSRRIDGRQSDIYVSRRENGRWQPAEPVAELNTEANEVGPVLAADGAQLYFYSDRPGGLGGTDIYVAERNADGGWEHPRNLGPKINSTAHEYDPALSPDGLSLYFASNRSGEVAQRIADDRQPAGQEWNVTLRAQLDLTMFDLYRARRDGPEAEWGPSVALDELNRPDSTEGAPFVSPDGAFLYFASDRPARSGERRNLDLYRARVLGDGFHKPENLGPGINTAAHETEPGLSAEGFTIVFSSNREGTDRLYASTATEVYYDTQWDASHLSSLGIPWWWWLPLTLAILAAIVLALLYYRNWLLAKVWPARFFFGGVLLNLLVLFLLAIWTFPDVMSAIVARVTEVVPAPDFVDDNQHQSHEDGRESHEKVADLQSVEAVPVPQLVRKETTPLSVPERTERLVPTIPVEQARALPQEKVIFVPRKADEPVEMRERPQQQPELARNRPRQPVLPFEERPRPDRPPELAAIELPQDAVVAAAEVEIARRPAAQPDAAPRPPQVNPLERMRPAAAAIKEVQPTESVLPLRDDPARPPLERPLLELKKGRPRPAEAVASIDAPALDVLETVPAEPPVSPARPQVDRTVAALNNPAALSRPTEPLPPASVVRRRMKVETAAVKLPDGGEGVEQTPTELAKTRPVEVAGVTVTSESPSPPIDPADVPKEMAIAAVDVELDRSVPVSPKAGLGETADRPRTADVPAASARPIALAAADASPLLPDAAPAEVADVAPLTRSRRSTAAAQPKMADDQNPAELAAAESESNLDAEAVAIALAKADGRIEEPAPAPDVAATLDAKRAEAVREQLALAKADAGEQPMLPDNVPAPLKRAARNGTPTISPVDAANDPLVELAAAELPDEAAPDGVEVAMLRTADSPLTADVATLRELTGPVTRVKHRVVIGELSDERNEAPPAFSPLANRLDRRRALATRVALAEDNVGLKSLFTLRQGETRRQYIELLGGTDESEKAVNLGLEWLAKHQEEDGSWDLKKHDGAEVSRTAGTGLGLLPFLAAGYTHNKPGQFQKTVSAAVRWMLEHQKENGDLLGPGDNQQMYSHGIAAIALCEAYGMSRDEELKEPARKAIDFIAAAQHQPSGGWRYTPNQPGDTSVVGWQVMALKSGEMAGLAVDKPVYDHAERWLASVEGADNLRGTFGYASASPTPAMTAEGLLSLQFLGSGRNSPRMRSGADYLMAHLPEREQKLTSYYWYYGTQVMYHMQGKYWEAWNDSLRDMLVETQIKTGEHAGTWHPRDQWETRGGRVYATSLKLLMLEVYYRHLPLYEQLEE